jgi:hypothetical protein
VRESLCEPLLPALRLGDLTLLMGRSSSGSAVVSVSRANTCATGGLHQLGIERTAHGVQYRLVQDCLWEVEVGRTKWPGPAPRGAVASVEVGRPNVPASTRAGNAKAGIWTEHQEIRIGNRPAGVHAGRRAMRRAISRGSSRLPLHKARHRASSVSVFPSDARLLSPRSPTRGSGRERGLLWRQPRSRTPIACRDDAASCGLSRLGGIPPVYGGDRAM